MKKAFLLMIALVTASFALNGNFDWQSFGGQPGDPCEVDLVEADAGHIVVDITVPGFWLGRTVAGGSTWDTIVLPEYSTQTEVGMPEVPTVPQMFALPFGSEPVVTIEDVGYTTYSGINLVPVQTPEIDMPHNPYPFRKDQAVYDTNSFFPGQWAETASPAVWGGINTDRLQFNPFRYNPVTGELMAANTIRVRIDFQGNMDAIAFPSTETVRNGASRMLINYDLVQAAASAPTDADAAEYIFVTTSANLAAITPLVEFYQGVGYETAVVTLPSGSSAGTIKAAIGDYYDTSMTRFALIAGDHAALPSYNYGSFIGDYWYACMVGTDLVPEIGVGRLTGNADQISHQVDKILNGYLQYAFDDSRTTGIIPSTTVLAADGENYPYKYTQCCNEVAAYDYSLIDMTFYKVYPPEGGTNDDVLDWFENEIGTVGYRGHGMQTYWAWYAPGNMTQAHINSLTNTFMPPVFNINCYNGRYQVAECFSETFQWADGGASGNLGANDPSYTIPNHDYMKQIYINIYDSGIFNVTEATNEAALWIVNNHGSIGETNAKMFIWFGDPAMELFTNDTTNPKPLSISTDPGMVNPGSQTITVTVTSQGSPVSGATVGLSDGIQGMDAGTFFETQTTNSSGEAVFSVNVSSSATHLYTGARLHNYNPDSHKIDVYPSEVDDTVAGVETFTLGITPAVNPIVGSSALNFSTPVEGHATVQVFDLAGRSVQTLVNEEVGAGSHSVNWTPGETASGVYFIRLTTPSGTVSTQAMVLR